MTTPMPDPISFETTVERILIGQDAHDPMPGVDRTLAAILAAHRAELVRELTALYEPVTEYDQGLMLDQRIQARIAALTNNKEAE